jgi:hypothetical protein
MMRLSSVFWVLLVSATALATYGVKYEAQALVYQLGDVAKTTASANREMRVLDAEWAYLNRPEMLAAMNERFLSLAPITKKQLQTAITDIPMRPPPPPPPPPPAAPAPQTAPIPGLGPVAAVATRPPATVAPDAPAPPGSPAAPERLAMASMPGKPLPVRETASASPPLPRTRSLDSRSLDQLIARIAGGR